MEVEQIATKGDIEELKHELKIIKDLFSQAKANTKQWLKSAEVQKLLSLSASGLQNLRINGTIPYTKVGGIIYYDLSDITNILEKNKVHN